MVPNDHAIMLYKFGENRWINKLLDGELSFSCAGAYIFQAKKTGNRIQGDELEGVFAKQHKDNPKIEEMRNILGRDLEEIPDGDYVFLRRRSAKLRPIFCIFAYTAQDAIIDGAPQKVGKQKVKFEFDQRLYEGFAAENLRNVIADSHRFTLTLIQAGTFIEKVKVALQREQKGYEMRAIQYIDMSAGEFFIEPTNRYPELFIKSSDYAYQHEARICLVDQKFSTIFKRYPLFIGKFSTCDYRLCHEAVRLEIDVVFAKSE